MFRYRACAASFLAAAISLIPGALVLAQSESDADTLQALEATWCTAPHDDYRRGEPVVEIRQFRDLKLVDDAKKQGTRMIAGRMRSAMVSTQSKRLDFVGAWIDYRFDVQGDSQLKDSSIGLTLSLSSDRKRLAYKYGDSKSYTHERCGAANVELVGKAQLPAEIPLSVVFARNSASVEVRAEATITATAESAQTPPAQSPDMTAQFNRSYCLAMERTPTGFFGFVNKCTMPANYTYCTLDASTANGRLSLCRSMEGEQIGETSGYLRPGDTAYIRLPVNDKGRVIWFACEYPATPSLTRADPPSGRCH